MNTKRTRQGLGTIAVLAAIASLLLAQPAAAGHVPLALDTPAFWSPAHSSAGYLEFINPVEHPALVGTPVFSSPPGVILTEEHTGFTTAAGIGILEVGDGDIVNGDMADFDWVQEHRPDETAVPPFSNHPGLVGAMGWTTDTPEVSPHIDPGLGVAHGHSVAEIPPGTLPVLPFPAYPAGALFTGVDVFSQITSLDMAPTPRDAALDYIVDFGNTTTGFATPGVPIVVFVPGWTGVTGIDDYVTRWVPSVPGMYDVVAIEPAFEFDEVTEIDAIIAFIPEPSSVVLAMIGVFGLMAVPMRRRKDRR